MSITNFIPAVWSSRLLAALDKALVFSSPQVINRDYEGEITEFGDSVKINSISDPTIGTYTKDTNIATVETLTDAQSILTINQAKYFHFQVDDIDKAQTKPKIMDEAMRRAGLKLKDNMDDYIAHLYTDIAAANIIATTGAPKTDLATAGYPYKYLLDMGVVLDDNDVPSDGRFVVVPPWFSALLLQDTKFVGSGSLAAEQRLANGFIGQAAGFNVFKSNNVHRATSTTSFAIIAGHPMAWSAAVQINKVETYRPELRFGDAVKGLMLYGAKVVRSYALACLWANLA